MKIIEVEGLKKPIFSWCPQIEQGALEQMIELAKLPFVEHCALMPDAHLGVSMPIGGVIACSGVIIPDAVGLDIGCGMGAFRTNLTLNDIRGKEKILHQSINLSIPMGFSHNTNERKKEMEQKYGDKIEYAYHIQSVADDKNPVVPIASFYEQMGTLGGGNHFLEIQYDEKENIWVMVHSGSRNIGKRVCEHFNEIADALNQKWHSKTTIPFLPVDTEEGKAYIGWMNMCLLFAFYNRNAMLEEIKRNMLHYFPNMKITTEEVCGKNILDVHHNYASIEHHMGKDLWVHRKGAILARKDIIGIIPGSQSTNSFITIGKGSKTALESSSHGSGRKMGRTEFTIQNQGRIQEIEDDMKKKGIVYSKFQKSDRGRAKGMLDISETGNAYKDVLSVMEEQVDLVEPLVKLSPVINWKG